MESATLESTAPARAALAARYREVRQATEARCAPLEVDDYQVQSVAEVSPPKWHLAHCSWFFETFVLRFFEPAYRPYGQGFEVLFNSYYQSVGKAHPRPSRSVLSRPTVSEVYRFRAYVDEQMEALLDGAAEERWEDLAFRVTLGLNHEQQHQELLLSDVKHNFGANPLRPAYQERLTGDQAPAPPLSWLDRPGGRAEIGHGGPGFAYDNETPRHEVLLRPHRLASRLTTCGEYLDFIEAGGYQRPELWLADGWAAVEQRGWEAPLYWERRDGEWWLMTLAGMRPLDEHEPVCHVSFYEADAYARFRGRRLPAEAEVEVASRERPMAGNFVESGALHPRTAQGPDDGQWFGDLWEWTASPYAPYPGFRPLAGSLGEYNGKFMCNQMVLRGGCCATPQSHLRPTYRNFFYPHDRWPFTGIRLAADP
jgi:ergothioneine biosynthesis protein EgtB